MEEGNTERSLQKQMKRCLIELVVKGSKIKITVKWPSPPTNQGNKRKPDKSTGGNMNTL